MPEKRNFWLKLNEHFFDDERIAFLLRQKGGDSAVVIYLKLLLKALNTGGLLDFLPGKQPGVRYIATALGVRPEKLRSAMEQLSYLELAHWYPDGSFYLPDLVGMVGSESTSAGRMRKKRALKVSQAAQAADNCDADKDTDTDPDKEKNIYQDSDPDTP